MQLKIARGLTCRKGYHVQVTARSDRDLTPDGIIQKVSDASGSKYSSGAPPLNAGGPPPLANKPAFTPTRSTGGAGGFNPLANSQSRASAPRDANVDEDGWGRDAPPVTRTQLEKVQPAYQPTKVNMRELSSQKPEPPGFNSSRDKDSTGDSNVVKGAYQPVGKVDIAALRKQAQETGKANDERPTVVKGSYEPVGKVDIAAIRARAQKPTEDTSTPPSSISPAVTGTSARSDDRGDHQKSLSDRSAPFNASERLTSLPKPKVANRFGSGNGFSGTKAPLPGSFGLESQKPVVPPPTGVGKNFADQGGKTPAQLWAEKKARERGISGANDTSSSPASGTPASPMTSQTSGEWKSGYGGKSWAPVQTTPTGHSSGSLGQQRTGDGEEAQQEAPKSPTGGVGAIRDRFKGAPPMGAANVGFNHTAPSPPPLDTSTKPNSGRGVPMPGLPTRQPQPPREEEEEQEAQEAPRLPSPPPQPPRSPTPPTPPGMDSGSPIRIVMPVGRGHDEVEDAREEQFSPPPVMPIRSLAQTIPHEDDLTEESSGLDPARAAGEAAAAASFGEHAVQSAHPGAHESGKQALVQYDYEKAEDNELELKEGEYVVNIEMVDDDWWMGQNARGETGLFPSNYVELVEGEAHTEGQAAHETAAPSAPEPSQGATATALYDYEAAEGNELSFPEDAKITNVVSKRSPMTGLLYANEHQQEFPDDDWWSGEYDGQSGLFPANYVRLDE